MTIPTYDTIMLPLLKLMSDGKIRRRPEITDAMSDHFKLTDEERAHRIKSGDGMMRNRTDWSITWLKKAEYLEIPTRGNIHITESGIELSKTDITHLNEKNLKELSPSFKAWSDYCVQRQAQRDKDKANQNSIDEVTQNSLTDTPEDALQKVWDSYREKIVLELQDLTENCTPIFFERLVVDVLDAMGYGGGFENACNVTQYGSDGGIDGIIKEDMLGLDLVYVQSKRQKDSVGRPALQAFVGAMQGEGVRKGVFVTTSTFTKGAQEYIKSVESRVVLIDGTTLAELMFDHNVGCKEAHSYVINKIDMDYFEENL